MSNFHLERLENWNQEASLKEACGLRWRSYLNKRHRNAYLIGRNQGTYRPVGYLLLHDIKSDERELVDLFFLENVTPTDVSAILNLLQGPNKLRLNPSKILAREDYELMQALGAAKDNEGVYRIGTRTGGQTGQPGRQVLTKEQLLGPGRPVPGGLPPREETVG